MKQTYRPGVYSRYDIISRRKSYRERYAFFCGSAKMKIEKNVPAGTVLRLNSRQQLSEFFEESGSGKVFYEVCSILLQEGVESLYVVPLTVDGTKADTSLYAPAIKKLCEIKGNGVILCDSTEVSVLQKICDEVRNASQNERERIAVGAVSKENAITAATQLNCERMVLCSQKGTSRRLQESDLLYSAAALAAMMAVADPGQSFHSLESKQLSEIETLTEEEIETMLQNGVTVWENNQSKVECIRCVTTRTTTAGETDRTFAGVNTVLMIDDIIRSVRGRLSQLIKGGSIGFSEDSIASQAAVVLDEKMQQGYVTAFEPPIAYRQQQDPTVCVVELEFHLAAVVSQIYLTAHILI